MLLGSTDFVGINHYTSRWVSDGKPPSNENDSNIFFDQWLDCSSKPGRNVLLAMSTFLSIITPPFFVIFSSHIMFVATRGSEVIGLRVNMANFLCFHLAQIIVEKNVLLYFIVPICFFIIFFLTNFNFLPLNRQHLIGCILYHGDWRKCLFGYTSGTIPNQYLSLKMVVAIACQIWFLLLQLFLFSPLSLSWYFLQFKIFKLLCLCS